MEEEEHEKSNHISGSDHAAGNKHPYRIAAASLFFGIMKTLAYTYTAIPFLSALGFPSVVYKLIPYVATLILLAFTSKNSAAPKASGIPYDKSKR